MGLEERFREGKLPVVREGQSEADNRLSVTTRIQIDLAERSGMDPLVWIEGNNGDRSRRLREAVENDPGIIRRYLENPKDTVAEIERKLFAH